MATGDETRWDERPSLFGDRKPAEETQVVQNPIPSGQPRRRGSAQPPEHPGRADSDLPPARYGDQTTSPYDAGPDLGNDFFNEPAGQGGGRPTILANQASEWERNLQEVTVSRGGRTGMIALFLIGLLAVIVIALVLAAWSVLRGGGDDTATDGATTDTSVPTSDLTGTDVSTPDVTTPETTPVQTGPVVAENGLRITFIEESFVCDAGTREFALIGGADPNESVAFTSPQAEGLRSGQADISGELPIRWQCDPDQAGTTWELTAIGETSGRSITFLLAGVVAPGQPQPGELEVQVIEDPFICDGTVRVFAGLTGADPNEAITFTSPQSPGLRPGQADAQGATPIRWQCDPDQAGTVWELTATGDVSGRTATFSFTGG